MLFVLSIVSVSSVHTNFHCYLDPSWLALFYHVYSQLFIFVFNFTNCSLFSHLLSTYYIIIIENSDKFFISRIKLVICYLLCELIIATLEQEQLRVSSWFNNVLEQMFMALCWIKKTKFMRDSCITLFEIEFT